MDNNENQGGKVPGTGSTPPPYNNQQMPPAGQPIPPPYNNQPIPPNGQPVPPPYNGQPIPPPYNNQQIPPNGQPVMPHELQMQGGAIPPPMSTPGTFEPKKAPKWLPIISAASIIAVLTIVVALLFGTGVLGASPLKTYKKLENKAIGNTIDKTTVVYASYVAGGQKEETIVTDPQGVDITVKATISEEAKSLLGLTSLDSFELVSKTDMNGELTRAAIDFLLNGTHLFSLDVMNKVGEDLLYFAIPEISGEYLKEKMSTYLTSDVLINGADSEVEMADDILTDFKKNPVAPEDLKKIMETYTNIWQDSIQNVKREKNAEFEVNGTVLKADLYTVSLNEKEVKQLLIEIAKTAKEDETLIKVCEELGISSKEEFITNLEEIISDGEAGIDSVSEDEFLLMKVWTQKNKIVGREVTFTKGTPVTISYKNAKDGAANLFNLSFSFSSTDKLEITCNSEENSNGYTGTLSLAVQEEGFDESSIDVDFENLKKEGEGKEQSFSGDFHLSSDLFMGMSFGAQIKAIGNQIDLNLDFLMGNLKIISLSVETSTREFESFQLPDRAYDIEDEEQVSQYLSAADVDAFIEKLSSNEDVKYLIEQFGGQFDLDDFMGGNENNSGNSGSDEGTADTPNTDDPVSGDGTYSYPEGRSDFTAYKGYTVDDTGWVDFDADAKEIKEIGAGSTGYDAFTGTDKDKFMGFLDGIAKELLGGNPDRSELEPDNSISGTEPDVYSYYNTEVIWEAGGEWWDYLIMNYDSVTSEVLAAQISYTDKDKAIAAAAAVYTYLSGDTKDITALIEKDLENEEAYQYFDGIYIGYYPSDEYIEFYIVPGESDN